MQIITSSIFFFIRTDADLITLGLQFEQKCPQLSEPLINTQSPIYTQRPR